ncbi:MAG: hypothetical protein ABIH46_01945, partial [Chloroflexota bacterium]
MELEKRGTPVATYCEGGFASLGQVEATALGVPSLPIVKIPVGRGLAADRSLPIGPDRADAALEEIIHILTT